MLIRVVKCLNEGTEEAMEIHQYTHESNMGHYSPLRKKSTGNCHDDENVARNLGKLEGNEFIASSKVARHCIYFTLRRAKSLYRLHLHTEARGE